MEDDTNVPLVATTPLSVQTGADPIGQQLYTVSYCSGFSITHNFAAAQQLRIIKSESVRNFTSAAKNCMQNGKSLTTANSVQSTDLTSTFK